LTAVEDQLGVAANGVNSQLNIGRGRQQATIFQRFES
jgi:hypothetical protein